MDLSILKYADILIGFALVMILAATVVTSITQIYATLARSRGKYLRSGLEALLAQADPANLKPIAREVSEAVLRHPMIGKPNWLAPVVRWVWGFFKKAAPRLPDRTLGAVVKREEVVRILLELAAGTQPIGATLRTAFGFSGAGDAKTVREAIEAEILKLESTKPREASHVRETQAMVDGLAAAGAGQAWGPGASALAARIVAWFDQTMSQVTQSYAFSAKTATALISLVLVFAVQLDSLDLIRRLATDDKMRATLVQQAEKQEKKIADLETQQSPAGDVAPLKKQKEDVEASIADLSQPSLGILRQFFQAATTPASVIPPAPLVLAVGAAKTYRLARNEKEGFTELASRINGLNAGVEACVHAQPESRYSLRIRSLLPGAKTLELRADPDGANLLGPATPYYSWANLGRAWKGVLLSWILLSLGGPFWYDMLKNLLRLRPMLASQEQKEREARQSAQ